ncbi:hypothetical protein M758_9G083400 [Ceratodon purpureus]|nr:hypothetical protein M758_9G083400 [Ceratodon purpureus]
MYPLAEASLNNQIALLKTTLKCVAKLVPNPLRCQPLLHLNLMKGPSANLRLTYESLSPELRFSAHLTLL